MKYYLLPFLLLASVAHPAINQMGDFQIWGRFLNNIPFSSQWSSTLHLEGRWGDHASKLYYTHIQYLVNYSPVHWIQISPGYRQIWSRIPLTSSHFEPIYSPMTDVSVSWKIYKWGFFDRNRVQYLINGSDPSHWLYRNRFRIVSPWKTTILKLNPFIDNEVFFQQRFGFNQDRFSIGFLMTFSGHATGEIFYMRRFQKVLDHWIFQNILNIGLTLSW